jgi:hypothetical protein
LSSVVDNIAKIFRFIYDIYKAGHAFLGAASAMAISI